MILTDLERAALKSLLSKLLGAVVTVHTRDCNSNSGDPRACMADMLADFVDLLAQVMEP